MRRYKGETGGGNYKVVALHVANNGHGEQWRLGLACIEPFDPLKLISFLLLPFFFNSFAAKVSIVFVIQEEPHLEISFKYHLFLYSH